MRVKCEYDGCEQDAEFWDNADNKVCRDCMEREIRNSEVTEDDFELLPDHYLFHDRI